MIKYYTACGQLAGCQLCNHRYLAKIQDFKEMNHDPQIIEQIEICFRISILFFSKFPPQQYFGAETNSQH